MSTNIIFEKLTEAEKDEMLPVIREELRWRIGARNYINSDALLEILHKKGFKKATEKTIRMIIFYLRNFESFGLLIANSNGHFISNDIEETKAWIETHKLKIASMQLSQKNIEKQLKKSIKSLRKGKKLNLGGQISIFDIIE